MPFKESPVSERLSYPFRINFRINLLAAIVFGTSALLPCTSVFGQIRGLPPDPPPSFLQKDNALTPNRVRTFSSRLSRWGFDSLANLRRAHIDANTAVQNTIPTWTDSVTVQSLDFTYRMVGTNPKLGSRTTVIPAEIIPLRFVFADGSVFDASTDIVDGQTTVQGMVNSPIFQNNNFVIGGTNIGNTQYADAFQRANFWNFVSRQSPNYHVLLGQPEVLPVQTIIVPADKGFYFIDPTTSRQFVGVDIAYIDDQVQSLIESLTISTDSLPIFALGLVTVGEGGAYHSAELRSSGVQTYIVTPYFSHDTTLFDLPENDSYVLSHEVLEWMDDPFVLLDTNLTSGWNFANFANEERCGLDGFPGLALEVADPLELLNDSSVAVGSGPSAYHVADAVFLDFFTRNANSRSVNRQYDMFNYLTGPSATCVGYLLVTPQTVDVPGSRYTVASNINNVGDVTGYFNDSQNRRRGFLLDNRGLHTIDFPSARSTTPQDISDGGMIVGFYSDSSRRVHGFSARNGAFHQIDFPGASVTVAYGINAAGYITGAYLDAQLTVHGFILNGSSFQTVDSPFAVNSEVSGIDDFGNLVGITYGSSGIPVSGFITGNSGFSKLDMPASESTFPTALNNRGMVSGYFQDPNGFQAGFVELAGHLHTLDSFSTYGAYAFGNNDMGQIVGQTYDPGRGKWVAYISTLPIHPGAH